MTTREQNLRIKGVALLGLLLGYVGCGGSGGSAAPVTTPGQSVWNSDVQTITVENQGGGFVPAPPVGSACDAGAGKYTLTVATRLLVWTGCKGDFNSGMPYTKTSGQRVLTEAELKDLSGTLGNLKVVATSDVCGADKPTFSATVITAVASQDYGDSFYACSIKDKPLLDSGALGQALQSLSALAM